MCGIFNDESGMCVSPSASHLSTKVRVTFFSQLLSLKSKLCQVRIKTED